MAISANETINRPPYMTPHQRRTINELALALIKLIVNSTCTGEIKGKARTIIDYYLINPFKQRQSDFFVVMLRHVATHDHAANSKYVPLLTMMLLSSHDLLLKRLEMLDMIDGLGFRPETVPTKEQLQNRFVEALALYTEMDHTNLDMILSFLPMHAFGCIPQPTSLKDLPE